MIKNNLIEYISEADNAISVLKEESGLVSVPDYILDMDGLIALRNLIDEVIADNGGFRTSSSVAPASEPMVTHTPYVPPVQSNKPPLIA